MNKELHYEVRGSGPVLLLIPGGNGDAGFYEPFAKALAGKFTVVDLPGGHVGYHHHGAECARRLQGILRRT
jgi:pimeloyl-ACP methyl ester carboxylesterase